MREILRKHVTEMDLGREAAQLEEVGGDGECLPETKQQAAAPPRGLDLGPGHPGVSHHSVPTRKEGETYGEVPPAYSQGPQGPEKGQEHWGTREKTVFRPSPNREGGWGKTPSPTEHGSLNTGPWQDPDTEGPSLHT